MEIGRGAKEGRSRRQEPSEMISSHESLSTSIFHPAHPTALVDTNAMSTIHPLIDHLYLDWARDPTCRYCLQVPRGVASRCSAIAWSFSITVPHLTAESMTKGVSCLCISSVSGALVLDRARHSSLRTTASTHSLRSWLPWRLDDRE